MKNLSLSMGVILSIAPLYGIDFNIESFLNRFNYESLIMTISEEFDFLAIGLVSGVFISWIIFRFTLLKYKKSIDYLNGIIKNQEKEIAQYAKEIQDLITPQKSTKRFLSNQKRKQKKRYSKGLQNRQLKSEDEILKEIEATLESIR